MIFAEVTDGWVKSTIDSAKYVVESFGWPGAIVLLAILGIVWYVRKYGDDHKAEIKARTAVLIGMADHMPKELQCRTDTVRVLEKLSEKSSDVVRTVATVAAKISEVEDSIDHLAMAQIEHACPETKKVMAAQLSPHVDRYKKRKEESGK